MNPSSILARDTAIAILKNPGNYPLEQVATALGSILAATAGSALPG